MQEDQQQSQTDDTDHMYTGEASRRRALCDFIRSYRIRVGIVVLLTLVVLGFAPLTFINKEEMTQLSTTVGALKRDHDNIRQLAKLVDSLKRDQDDERRQSTSFDTLKRDHDNIRQLANLVDTLKRDQDDLRRLSTTVDALKRDLDKERNRTAALEQRLDEMSNTQGSSLQGYAVFRGTFYRAFNTPKTFSEASVTCSRRDGGSLAIPRDAETNAFLISLRNSGPSAWFGLHDQREEGSFEWVDGSALGAYNSWGPGQPDNRKSNEDCVYYSASPKDKWAVSSCNLPKRFICQSSPGPGYKRELQ